MYTFVITGGHHNSALVVAQALVTQGHKVIWIGHRHTSVRDKSDSAEYQEVTASGIKFYDLPAGKLTMNLSHLLKIPLGIIHASKLLRSITPTAILSFGGYLGGTVALAGWFSRIPIYLHEQTVTAGRANKLVGLIAKKVFLTWPNSQIHFPRSKSLLVGLPLRASLTKRLTKPLFTRRKPTLLVMGGKQGAHSLNEFIFHNLDSLLSNFNIVHQTGNNTYTHDLKMAQKIQKSLGSLKDCYLPLGYIGEHEIGKYFSQADYYCGRSGAHVVYELAVLKIPSLLIPLMITHDSEQLKNAQILADVGLARIILPSELSLSNFYHEWNQLRQTKRLPLSLPTDATNVLVQSLLSEFN